METQALIIQFTLLFLQSALNFQTSIIQWLVNYNFAINKDLVYVFFSILLELWICKTIGLLDKFNYDMYTDN